MLKNSDFCSPKQKEISEKYMLLEQSTEYLNHIQRYTRKKDKLKPLTTQPIDQRELFLLLVQSIYLIFSSRLHNISIFMSKTIFTRKIQPQLYVINKLYILSDHYQMLQETLKKQIIQFYEYFQYSSTDFHFQTSILSTIQLLISKILSYSQRYPEYLSNMYKLPFDQFVFVINNFLWPKLGRIKESRKLIECLEKTEIFKGNSLYLVAKANIIYDQIKYYLQDRGKFRELLQIQESLKKETAINTSRNDQRLDYKQTTVKKYIDNFMSTLADLQILYTFVSNDKTKQQQKKQTVQEQNNPSNYTNKKQLFSHLNWEFFTKQSTFKLTPSNINDYLDSEDTDTFQRISKAFIPNRINHFIIEFFEHQQLIKVKMLVDLNTNPNVADSILYQINIITDRWNFPKIQTHESKNSQPNTKRIALSIIINLQKSKTITPRLLTILDTLIFYQKILLTQLNRSPNRPPFDPNPTSENITRAHLHFLTNIQSSYQSTLFLQPQQPS